MRAFGLLCALLLFLCCAVVSALEPFTILGGVLTAVSGVGFSLYHVVKCKLAECCQKPWVMSEQVVDRTLRKKLGARVYGQHIAIDLISMNVRNHLELQPSKPLVMVFHGGTGVGKNHISGLIAETVFKLNVSSEYYHLIVATLKFPISSRAEEYKVSLQELVHKQLKKCPRSVFVFDEVDKIPAGILDGIQGYLEYHKGPVHGVDPRGAIFIFLSNSGRQEIDKITYAAWQAGKSREDLTIGDYQKHLQAQVFNNKGSTGLYRSDLIDQELVDIYVPFLPLEKRHVEGCVVDYLKEAGYDFDDEAVRRIADEMDYFPPAQGIFSVTGCKRIREHVIANSRYLKREVDIVVRKEQGNSDPEEAEQDL